MLKGHLRRAPAALFNVANARGESEIELKMSFSCLNIKKRLSYIDQKLALYIQIFTKLLGMVLENDNSSCVELIEKMVKNKLRFMINRFVW